MYEIIQISIAIIIGILVFLASYKVFDHIYQIIIDSFKYKKQNEEYKKTLDEIREQQLLILQNQNKLLEQQLENNQERRD